MATRTTAPSRARKAPAARPAAKRPAVAAPKPRGNVFGPISIGVGVVALLAGLIPFAGFATWTLAIAGAVLGIVGATRIFRRHGPSIAGIVVGAIALVVGLAVSVASVQTVGTTVAAGGAQSAAALLGVAPSPTATPSSVASPVATPNVKRILADPSGHRYGGYPPTQKRFVHVLQKADAKFARAGSAKAGLAIIAARDAAACRVLTGNAVHDWVGRVHDVGTDENGNGWINIEISRTMVVQTWNNTLSDHGEHTLVSRRSPFHKVLSTVSQGSTVRFSGTLLSSGASCLEQQNLTTKYYGLDPNFIIRLSALSAG